MDVVKGPSAWLIGRKRKYCYGEPSGIVERKIARLMQQQQQSYLFEGDGECHTFEKWKSTAKEPFPPLGGDLLQRMRTSTAKVGSFDSLWWKVGFLFMELKVNLTSFEFTLNGVDKEGGEDLIQVLHYRNDMITTGFLGMTHSPRARSKGENVARRLLPQDVGNGQAEWCIEFFLRKWMHFRYKGNNCLYYSGRWILPKRGKFCREGETPDIWWEPLSDDSAHIKFYFRPFGDESKENYAIFWSVDYFGLNGVCDPLEFVKMDLPKSNHSNLFSMVVKKHYGKIEMFDLIDKESHELCKKYLYKKHFTGQMCYLKTPHNWTKLYVLDLAKSYIMLLWIYFTLH